VNGDLTPALIAAGAGTALLAGIWTYERHADETMRASMVRLGVRFPVGLDPQAAFAALDSFSGLPLGVEVVAELVARGDGIAHYLWVPAAVRASVESMLRGVIPSVRISEAPDVDRAGATLCLSFFIPTPALLHTDNAAAVSRTLLAGLTNLDGCEAVLRWALRSGGPRRLPEREPESRTGKDIDRAWRRKTAQPGMRAAGLLVVRAGSVAQARMLAAHVESVIRSRQGLAGRLRVRASRGNRSLAAMPRTTRTSGWLSSAETLALVGWPLGSDVPAGVEVGAARELLVPRRVPREGGRRLFVGRDAGGERPVVLTPTAATHHVAVVGPSGVGKSVLLAAGILSDIARGYGGLFIDPKGDAIDTILNRVRPEHAERIVVLDAGDDARAIPGLDVLHGGDPDAKADILVRTLRSMFPDWGIRSETFGRLGIRTLCELPGATLGDLGRLFAEDPYRRRAVAGLTDGFLRESWRSYESLSPAAKVDVVQAPMARVMALLARPRVRAVVASSEARIDVGRLFAQRRFLLVSMAPGALGDAAPLIGSAVMLAAWAAIEARVSLAPEHRHLINLYVDELATVANGLPSNLELVAERARGLGASLTVALQTLGRVPEPTRSAILGNLATLVSFRAAATEAPTIARELPGLSAEDLMALGQFEVAARVGTGAGSAVAVVTGRTQALPPVTGQASAIRDRSSRLYGNTPAASTHHQEPAEVPDDSDLVGARRRQP